ncbi:MAG: hypothetical protein ABIQ26_03905 [Streptosporangiaceae bacterium]
MIRRRWAAAGTGLAVGITATVLLRPAPSGPVAAPGPQAPAVLARPAAPEFVDAAAVWTAPASAGDPDVPWYLGRPTYTGLPDPPAGLDCPELYPWVRAHGSVPLEATHHVVQVRAIRPVRVKLISVRARLVEQARTVSGRVQVRCATAGFDLLEPGLAEALDEKDPELQIGSETDTYRAEELEGTQDKTAHLEPGGTVSWPFDVVKSSGSSDNRYEIDVTYLQDDRRRTVKIDDAGKPFLLASIDQGMGYIPPKLAFVRDPSPHFRYTRPVCDPAPCDYPSPGA